MTRRFFSLVIRLHEDESGQGLVEYLLILAMVALATIEIGRASCRERV